jgi:Flp pilus assembly pilin Flp
MNHLLCKLWRKNEGQDMAEYAAILAVILVLVVATIRLVGSNSNSVFSNAAGSIQCPARSPDNSNRVAARLWPPEGIGKRLLKRISDSLMVSL